MKHRSRVVRDGVAVVVIALGWSLLLSGSGFRSPSSSSSSCSFFFFSLFARAQQEQEQEQPDVNATAWDPSLDAATAAALQPLLVQCEDQSNTNAAFVACVTQVATTFLNQGKITSSDVALLVQKAQSSVVDETAGEDVTSGIDIPDPTVLTEIQDDITSCANSSTTHDEFVSCVRTVVRSFRTRNYISQAIAQAIKNAAKKSRYGG
jgi:hypothetical protein